MQLSVCYPAAWHLGGFSLEFDINWLGIWCGLTLQSRCYFVIQQLCMVQIWIQGRLKLLQQSHILMMSLN